jgi:hypothetical protein
MSTKEVLALKIFFNLRETESVPRLNAEDVMLLSAGMAD